MLKQIKNFLIMTLSITIMAIGVYYFKWRNRCRSCFCEDNAALSEYVFYYCEHASACSGLFLPWQRLCY